MPTMSHIPRHFELLSFDCDGTILHDDLLDHWQRAAAAVGLLLPDRALPQLAHWLADSFGSGRAQALWTEVGDPTHFWLAHNRAALAAAGIEDVTPVQLETLTAMLSEVPIHYTLDPALPGLLSRLRAAGYRLAMVTNRGPECERFNTDWHLDPGFEFILHAYSAEAPKPHPAPFRLLCELSGVAPQRVLHIGDNPHSDVVAAMRAGVQPLLLDPAGLWEAEWPRTPTIPTLSALEGWLDQEAGAGMRAEA